ncbi:MAG: Lipid A biosynthesis lauroyltransferase [Phycisphaerae bacterium]|nr:Lipid A biosynthesis lauroyltransferase [Phycisphaerae bacterium]
MRTLLTRVQAALDRRTAPPAILAIRHWCEYALVRAFVFIVSLFPIETNLASARLMGKAWWGLMRRHRKRALEHLRLALGDCYDEAGLERIARGCLEHFAQVYLAEMPLAPRLITEWSWARHVELGRVGPAVRELLGERGAIMLTGHFGNYELLGYTIARLGFPLAAIMRPLDNERLNEFIMGSRRSGGLELVMKKGASERAREVLENRGILCFIADQNAGRKGVFVDFFGCKASTYKSIGLLAMTYRVPVVVGYAIRAAPGFHYRIDAERVIQPQEWESQDEPLHWLTQEYSRALESAIRRHPEQYLWLHRRWKSRPRDEHPTTAG